MPLELQKHPDRKSWDANSRPAKPPDQTGSKERVSAPGGNSDLTRREFLGTAFGLPVFGVPGFQTGHAIEDDTMEPAQADTVTPRTVLPFEIRIPVDRNTLESTASATDALKAKDRAQARLQELEELDADEAVRIDGQVFRSINHHLNRGDLAFQAEDYDEAVDHYNRAKDQAQAGLVHGYRNGAETLLAAAETHLDTLESHGYITPEVAMLKTRVEKTTHDVDRASDLDSTRKAYRNAADVYTAANALPHPTVVQTADFLTRLFSPFTAVGIVVLGWGVWVIRRRRDDEEAPAVH